MLEQREVDRNAAAFLLRDRPLILGAEHRMRERERIVGTMCGTKRASARTSSSQ